MNEKQLQAEVLKTQEMIDAKKENEKQVAERIQKHQEAMKKLKAQFFEEEKQSGLNKIDESINQLKQTATNVYGEKFDIETKALQATIQKPTNKPTPSPEKKEKPNPTPPEEEKNFFEKGIDEIKKDYNEGKWGKLALKGIGAYAIYRGVKAIRSRWKELVNKKNNKTEKTDDSPRYKKLRDNIKRPLGIGLWGLTLFSQRDNLKDRRKSLRNKDGPKTTKPETITNPEQQKEQLEKSKHKKEYAVIGKNIVQYHAALNPDYKANTLSPLNPKLPGVTPMLLDGMYNNIEEITSPWSMHSEKRKKRREHFNDLIAKKSSDALWFIQGEVLEAIGITQEHISGKELTEEGREIVDKNKDKLRALQSQWFMDTKIYLHHIEWQLAYQLTKKALEKQNKPTTPDDIEDALEDDDFQEKYIEKELHTILSGHHLFDLPKIIEAYQLSSEPNPEIQKEVTRINEEKEDLVDDTFDEIEGSDDILDKKSELLAICEWAIEMTKDEDLRENTNLRLTDVIGQSFGTDGAIQDRVNESLGANYRRDAFGAEIQKIQTKITNGSATMKDIQNLEELIDSMYQFKQTVEIGGKTMIETEQKDGSVIVNITEWWETLFQRTIKQFQWDWLDIAQWSAVIALSGYVVTHRVKTLKLAGKLVANIVSVAYAPLWSAINRAVENRVRRYYYRKSQTPVIRKWQFMKYGKSPDTLVEAFKNGRISLEDAAKIAEIKSQKKAWIEAPRKRKRKDTKFFDATNTANNKKQLIQKAFEYKGKDFDLIEKYVDEKTRRELLFKHKNDLGSVEDLMKQYDDLIEGATWSLSEKQKILLQKIISKNKIPLERMKQIINEDFIKSFHLEWLDEKQLQSLARKLPSLLKKRGSIGKIAKHITKMRLRWLDTQDIKALRSELSTMITKYESDLRAFTGTPEQRETMEQVLEELRRIENMTDEEVKMLLKEGFWAKTCAKWKKILWPLTSRWARIGGKIGAVLKSPVAKTVGKVLGAAATVADIGLSAYDLYNALDDKELATINPTKHELEVEKATLWFIAGVAGTGLMFVPWAWWVVAGWLAAFQFGKEAYYDTMEKYSTNLAEFTRQTKPKISNHIISILSGRSWYDKGRKESFAEWLSSKDLDYMGGLVTDDAIEWWLRVDEFEHLTLEQQFAVQFHLAPTSRQQEMFAWFQEQNITFSEYKKQTENIFHTMVEVPATMRYEEIKKQIGTTTIQEQQTSRADVATSPLILLGPIGIGIAAYNKYNQKEASSAQVLDLKKLYDIISTGKHKTHEWLMKILNGGEYLESHEKKKQTLPWVYHALRRVATDVFGAHIPYTKEAITNYFPEWAEDDTGFYFTDDGKIGISNERESDEEFDLNNIHSAQRQAIITEIEEAVKENDLITINTSSGETELNQSIWYQILYIFKKTKPTI